MDDIVFREELNDHVVRDLYEAAAGLVPWSDALNGLYRELQVRQMQLLTIDKRDGTLIRSDQPSCMDAVVFDAILEYVREYHRCDPHVQYTGTLRVGVVVNTADHFPRAQFNNHPFYRDYWAAFGVRELLAAKVAEDDCFVVMLGMSRTEDMPTYSVIESRRLERYVGHLASAYRIVRHLGFVQATAQAGLALIETALRPMILLDKTQTIITCNRAGQETLTNGAIIYQTGQRLACRSSQASAELKKALSQVGMHEVPRAHGEHQHRVALRLESRPGNFQTMHCSLWAMRPATSMNAFGPSSVALLTIAPSNSKPFADPVFIASMFDLTPAEARLAVALVEGSELKEIAKTKRVSLETLRVQLKSIFKKTDTHRQSELISLLIRVAGG